MFLTLSPISHFGTSGSISVSGQIIRSGLLSSYASFPFYLGDLPFIFQFLVYCLQDGSRGAWNRVQALLTDEVVDVLVILICVVCVHILSLEPPHLPCTHL